MVGYGGKDLQKRKVLSLEWKGEGVMDNESGESMEPMEEVPLIELGEAELERLVRGWWRGAGSWFQRRGEAYWKERPTPDPWTIHLLMCCWDENKQWVLTDWQRSTRKETIQFRMHSGKSSWDSLAKSTGDRQLQKHGKSLSLNTWQWHNHSSRALW